jgi:hypothetical protein
MIPSTATVSSTTTSTDTSSPPIIIFECNDFRQDTGLLLLKQKIILQINLNYICIMILKRKHNH